MNRVREIITGRRLPFRRAWLLFPLDMISVCLAIILSFELRFNWIIPEPFFSYMKSFVYLSIFICATVFPTFGLYSRIWRYASIEDMRVVIFSISIAALVLKAIDFALPNILLPMSVWASSFLMILMLVGGIRLLWRVRATRLSQRYKPKAVTFTNVLIYGAGSAGSLVAKEIQNHPYSGLRIKGFVDDDSSKEGMVLNGVRILGSSEDVGQIIHTHMIDQILVAIPSLNRQKLGHVVDRLNKHKLPILMVPSFTRWTDSSLYSQVRPVQVEDLLGREPLPVDIDNVGQYLKGNVVLVTGAGGSIGSEICRQVACLGPQRLILLGRGENSIFEINHELSASFPELDIVPVIGDIRNTLKVVQIFEQYKPGVVFHAAAHKHVPLMEAHPDEAFVNNVVATKNLAELSERSGVSKFILISSDKAVRPTNVMGASKRVAEMVLQGMESSRTSFITVRFGNVLGSRGSVVRVFREQIRNGGPVTVTDDRMLRYFMTIPEAVRLVVEAGAIGASGKVYLFDMGEPVRILDLAEKMIRLSGFEPGMDIDIKITGKRPGEKLFEELSRESDKSSKTENDRIWKLECPVMPETAFDKAYSRMYNLYQNGQLKELSDALRETSWWEPVSHSQEVAVASEPVTQPILSHS